MVCHAIEPNGSRRGYRDFVSASKVRLPHGVYDHDHPGACQFEGVEIVGEVGGSFGTAEMIDEAALRNRHKIQAPNIQGRTFLSSPAEKGTLVKNNSLMQSKRVLVTGAGTGIGRGIALEFAREGASVALHYRRDRAGAVLTAENISQGEGTAKAFEADFRDTSTIRTLAEDVTTLWAVWMS